MIGIIGVNGVLQPMCFMENMHKKFGILTAWKY